MIALKIILFTYFPAVLIKVAIHLEIREKSGKTIIVIKKSGKLMKDYQNQRKVRENEIVLQKMSQKMST